MAEEKKPQQPQRTIASNPQAKPQSRPQQKPQPSNYDASKMKAAGVTAMASFLFSISQYKKILAILLINIVSFSALAYQTYYIMNYKPPIKYIPIYGDNTIIDPVPLTEPFKTEAETRQWLADASKDIFSYDYLNADSHGESIKKYFTDKGFSSYFSSYQNSPDYSRVKNKKLEVLASVIGAPTKINSGVSGGNYAYWEYKFTIRQLFISTTEGVIPVTYDMVATIVRQDQRLYKDGMAIHSIRVESSSNIR